ncbi:MAG: rRNA methyltransferase [Treponema sp.]|nr:rRNA methyltransferase [Treponema sp.]
MRPLETLAPSADSLAALAALEAVIDEISPIAAKHRAGLKGDIRRLWEDLTSDRESRSADYLSSPPALSAYLRYFLPWNVYRLSAILSNADFCLPDNAVVVDIGSGPLTTVIALWAARPELRDVPLTIYCLDRVERVMETGKAIFETLCLRLDGRIPPWRIELHKDSFGETLPERAHLLTAANVFNEFFWKDHRNLGERALATARTLLSYIRENGSVFIMEPGDPRSGAFVSSLRAALLAEGAPPLGPCPHALSCPMPGIFRHLLPPEETRTVKGDPNVAPSRFILPPVTMPKKRDKFPWCHFGIDSSKAPTWLQALSEEAGLPKEKASLSYLWAARGGLVRPPVGIPSPNHSSERERRARAGRGILVRVVSEPFALPDGSSGQYACSSLGYTLLKRQRGDSPFDSGNLLEVTASPLARFDDKSGAIVLPT